MRAGLGTIVASSAAPYGYTITIWSSGAVLMGSHGKPDVGDVFLFIAGAIAGFTALGVLAPVPPRSHMTIDEPRRRVLAGALDWASVGVAVGVVALIALLSGPIVWPLGSLAATVMYLAATGLQLGLVAAEDSKR